MKPLLALDAATEACSVALIRGAELFERRAESGKATSQQLLEMVQQVLGEAGISLHELDGIAASVGPGAFTGVRITVAVAQGLAFGASLPVVAVSTLEAMALQVLSAPDERALACLDARMGEVYWGCFTWDAKRGVRALCAPAVSLPDAVILAQGETYLGVGRGFSAYPQLAMLPGLSIAGERDRALPHAREIAVIGRLRLAMGEGVDAAQLLPQYLRDKVALTEAERAAR